VSGESIHHTILSNIHAKYSYPAGKKHANTFIALTLRWLRLPSVSDPVLSDCCSLNFSRSILSLCLIIDQSKIFPLRPDAIGVGKIVGNKRG